jgi:hypothetical protein
MKKYASKEDTQMLQLQRRDKRLMQSKEDAQYLQLQKRNTRMMQVK